MAEVGSAPPHSTPVPDPTVLTTEALTREVGQLERILVTRMDAMDKARTLFDTSVRAEMASIRHQIEAATAKVYETFRLSDALRDEKFAGIAQQFRERDTRVEQTARDTKVAVDAALQAAEKAVGKQNDSFTTSINKSEAATVKQIDQQSALLQTATDGLRNQMQDMKERLDRMGGESAGAQARTHDARSASSNVTAIVGLVVGAIAGLGGLLVAFWNHDTAAPLVASSPAATVTQPPQIIYVPIPPPAAK